jgi:hypothetical protein
MPRKAKVHPDDVKSPIDGLSNNDLKQDEKRFKANLKRGLKDFSKAIRLMNEDKFTGKNR